MKLFNSLTNQLTELPTNHQLSIYSCGPTVYNTPTIGNWRTYVVNDLLVRAVKANGLKVDWGLNYTDVGHLVSDADTGEDKLQRQAKLEKTTSMKIAERQITLFEDGMASLNITQPDHILRATAVIADMISLIKTLEEKGFTYPTSDGIYFDTSKFSAYGKLARLDIKGLKEGARVEANPEKRNITDFALWKFSPKNEKRDLEWDSPWGVGFPGWHIECSAMATKLFGSTIDIHTGGVDLKPTHHQNEIAQSEAATGQQFVKVWVHVEHLLVNNQRMGKSEGNSVTLADLQAKGFSPLDLRYLYLTVHYRQKQNFTWEALAAAAKARHKLVEHLAAAEPAEVDEKFIQHINELAASDLNYPKVIATIHTTLKNNKLNAATLKQIDQTLLAVATDALPGKNIAIPPEVVKLAEQREQARRDKKFTEADNLRRAINEAGFSIEDGKDGFIILPLKNNIPQSDISEKVQAAVDKIVQEYGDVLKKLGDE